MCCRYAYWDSATIRAQYNVPTDLEIKASYNVAPHAHIPIITAQIVSDADARYVSTRTLEIMQWGLIPEWAKPEKITGFFNARQETITKKPSFKINFKLRRCVVPARGFYEWDKNTKQPYYITTPDEHVAFAGIWDGGSSGIRPTVAIITTKTNALSTMHDRTPVVLDSSTIDTWLHPLSKEQELVQMLADADDTSFQWYPVSKRINHVTNNDKDLLQRADPHLERPLERP